MELSQELYHSLDRFYMLATRKGYQVRPPRADDPRRPVPPIHPPTDWSTTDPQPTTTTPTLHNQSNKQQALDAFLASHPPPAGLVGAVPRWPHTTWKRLVGGLEVLLSLGWMTVSWWRTAGG